MKRVGWDGPKENNFWRPLEKGVLGWDRNIASVASYASTIEIFYVLEVWHSSNTVHTNGPRLGFPYYDSSTSGAFTAEGIPLSATWGRAWLLNGSSRLPQVYSSRSSIVKFLR